MTADYGNAFFRARGRLTMGGERPHRGWARWDGDDLLLTIRVVPRAAAEALLPESDSLKVRLTAPPVDGKANAALCRLLAETFGVARSRVRIEKGGSGRLKRVRVESPGRLPDFLSR